MPTVTDLNPPEDWRDHEIARLQAEVARLTAEIARGRGNPMHQFELRERWQEDWQKWL